MIDNHVHIGQFANIYYEPNVIFTTVFEAGIDELFFSSTTTCKDNIRYVEVEKEISNSLLQIGSMAGKTHPLLWYKPDYKKQGISIEKAMCNLPYCGIKIHPFAHDWDINNTIVVDLLHSLFDYAHRNEVPILVHTGVDSCCEANKFIPFYAKYTKAQCILAHGRPLKQTISLLNKFMNVYCDTAFMPLKDFKCIIDNELGNKVIIGSDFPITHYYSFKYGNASFKNNFVELKNQYRNDIETMKYYELLLTNGAFLGGKITPKICDAPNIVQL